MSDNSITDKDALMHTNDTMRDLLSCLCAQDTNKQLKEQREKLDQAEVQNSKAKADKGKLEVGTSASSLQACFT